MTEKTSDLPVKQGEGGQELMSPFMSLRREIDHLFDDFFSLRPFRSALGRQPMMSLAWDTSGALRHADFVERDDAFEISVEVPGMTEKDITVSFTDSTLTVKGETSEEKKERKEDYYLSERRRGSFTRRFQLPEGIDEDKVDAALAKGVLTITLPKKPEAQKKQKTVEVKAAE